MYFDECTPEYAGEQCYNGELEYVVQCTSKSKLLYFSFSLTSYVYKYLKLHVVCCLYYQFNLIMSDIL